MHKRAWDSLESEKYSDLKKSTVKNKCRPLDEPPLVHHRTTDMPTNRNEDVPAVEESEYLKDEVNYHAPATFFFDAESGIKKNEIGVEKRG